MDKYKLNTDYRRRWKDNTIKFNQFVNTLGNWKYIDKHHFTPQTSEAFTDKIINSKNIKCFDIENIDYQYIEKLYNKKIPIELINFKGNHIRKNNKKELNQNVFDLNMEDYYDYKIETKYFYNDELKKKYLSFTKMIFYFLVNLVLIINYSTSLFSLKIDSSILIDFLQISTISAGVTLLERFFKSLLKIFFFNIISLSFFQ